MKKLIYPIVFAILVAVVSCGNKDKKVAKLSTSGLKTGKHCYLATFEKDSARLTVDIDADGRLKGILKVDYYNTDTLSKTRQSTDGEFGGQFKGDTLLADYAFSTGKNKDAKYFNPIALLHKGDTLIMGRGAMYYYLGRTYFDPKTPIDYSRSRFKFAPVDCK
jgi:hypothetical protein